MTKFVRAFSVLLAIVGLSGCTAQPVASVAVGSPTSALAASQQSEAVLDKAYPIQCFEEWFKYAPDVSIQRNTASGITSFLRDGKVFATAQPSKNQITMNQEEAYTLYTFLTNRVNIPFNLKMSDGSIIATFAPQIKAVERDILMSADFGGPGYTGMYAGGYNTYTVPSSLTVDLYDVATTTGYKSFLVDQRVPASFPNYSKKVVLGRVKNEDLVDAIRQAAFSLYTSGGYEVDVTAELSDDQLKTLQGDITYRLAPTSARQTQQAPAYASVKTSQIGSIKLSATAATISGDKPKMATQVDSFQMEEAIRQKYGIAYTAPLSL